MKKKFEVMAIVGIVFLLAGCGGGTNSSLGSGGGTGGGGTKLTVELGSGSGSSFQQGVLSVAVSHLSAGSSTTISASLQNSDGTPYTQSATVAFTSPCYQNGLSSFAVNGTQTNTVTTTTGQMNITYTASGCSGSDTITATTTVNGNILTAVGTVTATVVELGSGSGSSFQQGVLSVAVSNLLAGNSTIVSASLQNSDGTPYTQSATVAFTSPCYQNGLSSFSVNGTQTNTVTTTTGQANITYTAGGCSGLDTITATTTVNGNTLTAVGTVTVVVVVELGSGSGSSFQQGVLSVAVSNLSAGGSTTISASLQNSDGTPYIQSATVAFTSPCYQNGLSSFSVNGTQTNTVTTTTGQANITYTAGGCSGSDTITATTTVNGNTSTAVGTVTVAAATVGSIQFVSATPSIISLQGSGGPSTSIVVFKVTDSAGGSVPNVHVAFTLNTTVGGITLTPVSTTTDNGGLAQTVLQAGTQHTTVRITAQTTGAGGQVISTQSSGIVISTGIPTQNNFSMSLTTHNVEGFGVDGTPDTVTVRLADRFHNPVPDGTAVSFTTSGGHIGPSCTTIDGTCQVTWISANPRPQGGALSILGHAEILAYTTGEESFTDVNGDGVFDDNDQFSLYTGGAGDNFFSSPALPAPGQDDIGEVYLDQNESGHYANGDFFFDFNNDGIRNPPDGKYHGLDCGGTATVQCGTSTLGIGLQSCIVMSTSGVTIKRDPTDPPPASTLSVGQTAHYDISDFNSNVPPKGMTFSINANGPSVSILQTTVPDIGCKGSSPPNAFYPITVIVSSQSLPGTFIIEATSPASHTISYSNTITVQ